MFHFFTFLLVFTSLILFYVILLTFWHQSFTLIQINHQPEATIFQFIILAFLYISTCFGRFPAHHQELCDCSGSLWFYRWSVVIAVLCSWSGRPARPRTQHDCHHDTKVKPGAAMASNSSFRRILHNSFSISGPYIFRKIFLSNTANGHSSSMVGFDDSEP
jgi:hypothetical protein